MRNLRLMVVLVVSGVALVLGMVALAWALGSGSSQAGDDMMHNCPQANKWAIAVWDGPDGAETGQALATCAAVPVLAAYHLDPETGGWSAWFRDHPDPPVSNLQTLNNWQAVIALGGAEAQAIPTPSPTPGSAGDVILVSSNAFTTTSSWLIDGESRRMHVVGELRNESATPRSAGGIGITIYDAADDVIGRRKASAFDDIIQPGRTTAFRETHPSMTYWSDETNDFPEGWTRYEVTLSPRDPYDWEEIPVDIAVENVQVTDGGRHVTGNAVNASSKTVDKYGVDVYAIYYRADGTILNAKRHSAANDEPLGPGESVAFDVSFSSSEPVDFSSYIVQAYAEAE